MEQWKYRLSSLRFINVLYLIVLITMSLVNKSFLGDQYFETLIINGLFILVLLVMYIISYVKRLQEYYQTFLYTIFWVVTILTSIISYLNGYGYFFVLHILLLFISVATVFNKKIFNWFVLAYLLTVVPTIIISQIEVEKKIVTLVSVFAILALAYMKNLYDTRVYHAYEASQHEQELILENAQEAFALHEMIFNDLGEPINYRYININKSFEKLTGLSKEMVIGNTVLDILPGTEKYWIKTFGEVVLNGVTQTITNYSSELEKYYEVSAYPVGEKHFAVLFTDVTERIHADRKLKYALEKSEKADKLKNQFLRDINHRLRTPLNGMMGMMQLINIDDIGEENKELLSAALMEMRHSRNIINQISKYVDLQGMKFEYTQQDVVQLVKEQVQALRTEENNIELTLHHCSQDLFYIEKTVLLTTLKELIINALKHTQNGKINVKLDGEWSTREGMNFFRVDVIDYGDGISEENLKYIFNEFYHHDFINIYKDEDKVSVPICKQMLLSCGGDLLVSSKIGQGSVFTIILPVNTINISE